MTEWIYSLSHDHYVAGGLLGENADGILDILIAVLENETVFSQSSHSYSRPSQSNC